MFRNKGKSMYELLYTSVSSRGLNEDELIDIQQVSMQNNFTYNVTGMLVYYDREIMQLLEGEEEDVKALYQRIQRDERHTLMNVFYQGEINERAFDKWSMEAVILDDEKAAQYILNAQESKRDNPISHLMNEKPNRGKKTFLSLRDSLFS